MKVCETVLKNLRDSSKILVFLEGDVIVEGLDTFVCISYNLVLSPDRDRRITISSGGRRFPRSDRHRKYGFL